MYSAERQSKGPWPNMQTFRCPKPLSNCSRYDIADTSILRGKKTVTCHDSNVQHVQQSGKPGKKRCTLRLLSLPYLPNKWTLLSILRLTLYVRFHWVTDSGTKKDCFPMDGPQYQNLIKPQCFHYISLTFSHFSIFFPRLSNMFEPSPQSGCGPRLGWPGWHPNAPRRMPGGCHANPT